MEQRDRDLVRTTILNDLNDYFDTSLRFNQMLEHLAELGLGLTLEINLDVNVMPIEDAQSIIDAAKETEELKEEPQTQALAPIVPPEFHPTAQDSKFLKALHIANPDETGE